MHRKSAENYFVLKDNIMYKKYARKIFFFLKIKSVNEYKSPVQIWSHGLRFTSLILYPLNLMMIFNQIVDTNHLAKHLNYRFLTFLFKRVSLHIIFFLKNGTHFCIKYQTISSNDQPSLNNTCSWLFIKYKISYRKI